MTDKELIARLRLYGSKFHHEFGPCVADRIEELIAEREKDHANINLKADFIEKTLNQLAETEAKLAKTAKVALAYEDWVTDAYDLLEERREEFDPESPSDKAIMDLMDKAEAGIARATLAEIKGETK